MRSLIIKTKFIAPSSPKLNWKNKKLWKKYKKAENYLLTVVKAGPGYGKSTTIVSFFKENYENNYYWYSIDDLDSDPSLFFLNFFHAFKFKNDNIGNESIKLLNQSGDKGIPLQQVIDIFINELLNKLKGENFIILDDFHLVNDKKRIIQALSYFIKRIPPNLHLIISTREKIDFSQWARWKLKKQVLLIEENELTLKKNEIFNFLNKEYNLSLSNKDIENIYEETEGWIMAIDLIGERINNGTDIDEIINNEAKSLKLLFEYLAFEVLENQNEEIKEFLLKTSLLKYLRSDICNKYLNIKNSKEIINKLLKKRLFIYSLGNDQYRYHHLFHEFLRKQAKEKYNSQKLHKKAANICEEEGEKGFAIYHSLGAQDYEKSAKLILSSAEKLLELGRLDTLQDALNQLPKEILNKKPLLYVYQGDIFRLRSRFNEALKAYKFAESYYKNKCDEFSLSLVYQKIAMIYLDTVQPSKADYYLKEALKLREKENLWDEKILLKLMAENKANEGDLDEAEKLFSQAKNLNEDQEVSNNNFNARIKLRTGRLNEGQEILESKLKNENKNNRIPRSHRETILILSLIHSFKGNADLAKKLAKRGTYLGEKLNSPFIKAVSYMRLGHAEQLIKLNNLDSARKTYKKSLDIIDTFNIPRGKAEPLMGLSLLEGFYGDTQAGLEYGKKGLNISKKAGDEWLSAILNFSIAINYYFENNLQKSEELLLNNILSFEKLNDNFLKMINRLWLSLVYLNQNKSNKFKLITEKLFTTMEEMNFDFILFKSTLFTGESSEKFIPILLEAKKNSIKRAFVQKKLKELGIPDLKNHPGYKLKIKGFGNFKIYRGRNEIKDKDWEREKARELLLLFVINIGELIPKEKIFYYLWPEKNKKKASRNFKVTLNSLKNTLEPNRIARQKPYFINRRSSSYGFNEKSAYIYDVEEFKNLIEKGEKSQNDKEKIKLFESALKTYNDDFATDKLYLDWIREERENLKNLFLNSADKLIELYYNNNKYEKAIEISDRVLEVDNCWENAYLIKMKSYKKLDRRSMAIKVYERCKIILDRELNVTPINEINKYYKNELI